MSSNPLDIGLGIEKGDIIKLTFTNDSHTTYTDVQFPKFTQHDNESYGFHSDDDKAYDDIDITGTIDLLAFASFLFKHKVWIKRFWYQVITTPMLDSAILTVLQTPIKLMHEGIAGHGSYTVKRFILDPYQKQTNIVVVNTLFLLAQHNFIQQTLYHYTKVSYWFEIDKVI